MNRALLLMLGAAAALAAQTATSIGGLGPAGQMRVNGTTVKFTNVYAYLTEGFFDKKKDDTVVLLSDRALTDAQMRDEFGLRRMAGEGKLNCVRATIGASGQMVNYLVGSQAFKAIPSGGSTEQVFEGTNDGRTIAGKVHTKGEQTFFGTKYEYEATFRAAVQPRK